MARKLKCDDIIESQLTWTEKKLLGVVRNKSENSRLYRVDIAAQIGTTQLSQDEIVALKRLKNYELIRIHRDYSSGSPYYYEPIYIDYESEDEKKEREAKEEYNKKIFRIFLTLCLLLLSIPICLLSIILVFIELLV